MTRRAATPEILTEDLVDSRIGVHDSDHFEVKLDYAVQPGVRVSHYRVESYLFLPQSLGINRHTYAADHFYRDVQAYIRFKTPCISLSALADTSDPETPLAQVQRLIAKLEQNPQNKKHHQWLSQQLRMVGCVVRANLRDAVRELRTRMRELDKIAAGDAAEPAFEELEQSSQRLLADLDRVMAGWRSLRPDVTRSSLPHVLIDSYLHVDEYMGLIIEDRLTALVKQIDSLEQVGDRLAEVRRKARDMLLAERRYSEGVGHPSATQPDGDNEYFVYRQGMLKKFVMSVLWLEISKEKEGRGIVNLIAALAAGAAMFLALLATVYQSRWVAINTWGFVAVATVTYMLKDRIKEWMRSFLSSQLGRWLADFSVKIRDPATGTRMGYCRESFSYVASGRVPAEVRRLRQRHAKSSIEPLAKPEVAMRYQKDIHLLGKDVIERLHVERYGLNDIIRFAISRFTMGADDPVSIIPRYDAQRDRVRRHEFRKVYHLNVVMVVSAPSAPAPPSMRRIRVVFDKYGIRRLDEVS